MSHRFVHLFAMQNHSLQQLIEASMSNFFYWHKDLYANWSAL